MHSDTNLRSLTPIFAIFECTASGSVFSGQAHYQLAIVHAYRGGDAIQLIVERCFPA